MDKKRVENRIIHTIQLGMLLITALILILFAHTWLPPELVFSSMIAGVASLVGARIAANDYQQTSPPGQLGQGQGGQASLPPAGGSNA